MTQKLPLLLIVLGASIANVALTDPSAVQAQTSAPSFTTASLKGTCGFSAASTIVNPFSPRFEHPNSSFGTLVFNGAGAVTATSTVNQSGKLSGPTTLAGSYLVGADGRTGTLDFSAAGGSVFQFVITAGGNEIRYINAGPVDPKTGIVDTVVTAVCKF